MIFDVEAQISHNTFTCEIISKDPHSEDLFACYLVKDGEIIIRDYQYRSSNTFEWELTDSGLYAAQGFIKRDEQISMQRSDYIKFKGINFEETYKHLYDEFKNDELPELSFYKLEYPHQDIAVIFSENINENKTNKFHELCSEESLILSAITTIKHKKCFFITNHELSNNHNEPFAFSGITRNQFHYIYGDHDISPSTNIESLSEGIGDYFLVSSSNEKIVLSNDYFGISKIYYYHSPEIFIATNRYHLLLLLIAKLGIKLNVNQQKILSNLLAVSQFYQQNFSQEMEFEKTYVLPIDQKIQIDSNGVQFLETSIHETLYSPEAYNEKRYQKLLPIVAEEIIDNTRIVLDHPSFEYVRADLSGGLDARMMFAALTHMPQYKGKIHIHTANMLNEPGDLPVSASLTNMYNYQYDMIPVTRVPTQPSQMLLEILSYHLGTYHMWTASAQKNIMPHTVRLNGYFGEICARPYYARYLFGTKYVQFNDIGSFVDEYVANINQHYLVHQEKEPLRCTLKNEFSLLPGRTSLEKLDLHYLYYRNGLHCTDKWLSKIIAPAWGPLQSKTMFHLKNMTFHQFQGIRLQLDVIQELNPLVASLPYGRDRDNQDKLALLDQIYDRDKRFKYINCLADTDTRRWEESKQKKAELCSVLDRVQLESIQQDALEYPKLIQQLTKSALVKLVSHNKTAFLEDKQTSRDILVFLLKNSNNPNKNEAYNCLLNKILSLYYQVKIFEDI